MREKPNKGWIKELAKPTKQESANKPFNYNKPVSKVTNPNNMAVNSRSRQYKSVKVDKSTSFAVEQKSAKQSHKGYK